MGQRREKLVEAKEMKRKKRGNRNKKGIEKFTWKEGQKISSYYNCYYVFVIDNRLANFICNNKCKGYNELVLITTVVINN